MKKFTYLLISLLFYSSSLFAQEQTEMEKYREGFKTLLSDKKEPYSAETLKLIKSYIEDQSDKYCSMDQTNPAYKEVCILSQVELMNESISKEKERKRIAGRLIQMVEEEELNIDEVKNFPMIIMGGFSTSKPKQVGPYKLALLENLVTDFIEDKEEFTIYDLSKSGIAFLEMAYSANNDYKGVVKARELQLSLLREIDGKKLGPNYMGEYKRMPDAYINAGYYDKALEVVLVLEQQPKGSFDGVEVDIDYMLKKAKIYAFKDSGQKAVQEFENAKSTYQNSDVEDLYIDYELLKTKVLLARKKVIDENEKVVAEELFSFLQENSEDYKFRNMKKDASAAFEKWEYTELLKKLEEL